MAGEQVKPSTLRKGRVTMGKVKRKARARVEFVTAMDATPERLAKGDHSEMVNPAERSEEHTSELQSLMRISYAVFCLKKKNNYTIHEQYTQRCKYKCPPTSKHLTLNTS